MKANTSGMSVQPGTCSTLLDSVKLRKSRGRVQKVCVGWQGWKLGQEFLSHSVLIKRCPETGLPGNTQRPAVRKGLYLTGHRPPAHSISQAFGPQDLSPLGHCMHHPLSRPKVTRVTGRLLHAFVLFPMHRVLGYLSSLERVSTGNGLQRLPCGSPTGNPGLFKTESSRINREINWGK